MLGIGAAHQKGPNGIAWKQNKDFENLLKRLNEHTVHNTPGRNEDEDIEAEIVMGGHKEKRKHGDGEDGSARKKKRKRSNEHEEPENSTLQPVAIQWDEVIEEKALSVEVKKSVAYLPRHRAHRARAIAAKNISSKSSVHISEILGVAPTTPIPSQNSIRETSQGTLTSTSYAEGLENSKITTSTKSLTDYFKEKLNARSSKPTDSAMSSPSCSNTEKREDQDFYDAPRMGLGSSYLRLDIHSETRVGEETQKVGWSKFSSLVSSSLLAATSSLSSHVALSTEKEDNVEDARIAQITEVPSESEEDRDRMKKRVKKVKKKEISNNSPQQGDADDQLKGNKSNHDRKGKVEKSEEKDGFINEEEDKRKRRKEKGIK